MQRPLRNRGRSATGPSMYFPGDYSANRLAGTYYGQTPATDWIAPC
jgi:hypothetical protein